MSSFNLSASFAFLAAFFLADSMLLRAGEAGGELTAGDIRRLARERVIEKLDNGAGCKLKKEIFGRVVEVDVTGASKDGLEIDYDEELLECGWDEVTDAQLGRILAAMQPNPPSPLELLYAGILIRFGDGPEAGNPVMDRALKVSPENEREKFRAVREKFFGKEDKNLFPGLETGGSDAMSQENKKKGKSRPRSRPGVWPRVFATPEEIQGIKYDSVKNSLKSQLLSYAAEAAGRLPAYVDPNDPSLPIQELRPWPEQREGDIGELLRMRIDSRDINALSLAYALTGNTGYADKAWRNVRLSLTTYEAFGSFSPIRRNRDLSAGHMFGAIAMCWDLCHDRMPDDVRELVLTEGVRRARDMYGCAVGDFRKNGMKLPPDISTADNSDGNRNMFSMLYVNHSWVDLSGLGCLGLALEGDDVSGAGPGSKPEDWVKFAVYYLTLAAENAPPDGSYPESRVYGAPYALEGATPFFDCIKRVKGVDFYSMTKFYRNFAYCRMYQVWEHANHKGIANFGEGPDREWQAMGWIWAIAASYRDPALQWSANVWHRAAPTAHQAAWQFLLYDSTLSEKTPDQAGCPPAFFQPDMSMVHIRAGEEPWGHRSIVFSLRGSTTGKNQYDLKKRGVTPYVSCWHMHGSANSFAIGAFGENLTGRAAEGGSGTVSSAYNVPLVDGMGQMLCPPKPTEGILDYDATDKYITFSSEVGGVYDNLDSWRRRVFFIPPDVFVVMDSTLAGKDVSVRFRLHLGKKAHPSFKGARVSGSLDGFGPYTVDVVSPEPLFMNLGSPAGNYASATLEYGPKSRCKSARAAAVIFPGADTAGCPPAAAVKGRTPNIFGAAFTARGKKYVLVFVGVDADRKRLSRVSYILPKGYSSARHIVAGMSSSRGFSVSAGKSYVSVSAGGPVKSSCRGTAFFDVAGGKARPVKFSPLQNIADE